MRLKYFLVNGVRFKMQLTSEQLERLKKIQLDMLREFIRVCNALNLKYYLLGGTLLGAVRHQGFIPWDDDIDVGMPRKDYEIFVKKAQEFLADNLFLQNIHTDKAFPANFSKIRNNDTTYVELSMKDCKMNHGVFIDVFPLDYFPDDEKERNKIRRKNRLLYLRISSCFNLPQSKRLEIRIARIVLKVIFPSLRWALRLRENLFKSVPASGFLANYCGAWGEREIVPKEWYAEGVELTFEGLNVIAPKEYDKWLTQVYGDYMQLPPKEKRVGHHYVEVIDLDNSYVKYK